MTFVKISEKKGFTLTELLIVVIIFGILAAIATPLYTKTVRKGRLSNALSVLSLASQKQEQYFIENGVYAKSFNDLSAPVKGMRGDIPHTTIGVEIGGFNFAMNGACISAESIRDQYTIYRNFVTDDIGCVGEGCQVTEGVAIQGNINCIL
jgi:prepilin-type N-terminal cleavage/methylation domain-containing protein